MPGYGDGWKRRGQARAALGQPQAALADFTKALALVAEPRGRAEALAERGTLLQKQRDLRRAAKDLEEAASLDSGSKQVRRGCAALPASWPITTSFVTMLAQQQLAGLCVWNHDAALTFAPKAAKALACADLSSDARLTRAALAPGLEPAGPVPDEHGRHPGRRGGVQARHRARARLPRGLAQPGAGPQRGALPADTCADRPE